MYDGEKIDWYASEDEKGLKWYESQLISEISASTKAIESWEEFIKGSSVESKDSWRVRKSCAIGLASYYMELFNKRRDVWELLALKYGNKFFGVDANQAILDHSIVQEAYSKRIRKFNSPNFPTVTTSSGFLAGILGKFDKRNKE
jgi:hypothetical protein